MTKLDSFIVLTEVEDAVPIATSVFARRYRLTVPEFPHHVVAFYVREDGASEVACYIHFTDCGDLILCGGACTDNLVLRKMTDDQRNALRTVGGIFQYTLNWSMHKFSKQFAAVFGFSGDTATRRVTDALGWQQTQHPHLLVYWMQEVEEKRRAQMTAKAHSFGAF